LLICIAANIKKFINHSQSERKKFLQIILYDDMRRTDGKHIQMFLKADDYCSVSGLEVNNNLITGNGLSL